MREYKKYFQTIATSIWMGIKGKGVCLGVSLKWMLFMKRKKTSTYKK